MYGAVKASHWHRQCTATKLSRLNPSSHTNTRLSASMAPTWPYRVVVAVGLATLTHHGGAAWRASAASVTPIPHPFHAHDRGHNGVRVTDPCHVRTGNPDVVPCLRVRHCEDVRGPARIDRFFLSPPPVGLVPPLQETNVEVCYDERGMFVTTRAWDDNVFSNATKCNDPVFALGDVLEVFVGPVEDPTDDPEW